MNKNDSFLKKNKKAFTLVEVVIVLAITVIVLAIMYEFLTESKKAMVSNEVNSTLQSEADNIASLFFSCLLTCAAIRGIIIKI